MNYDSLIKVENVSEDITYVFAFNSQRTTVRPGATSLVPFVALVRQMGDPRSGVTAQRLEPEEGGIASIIPSRSDEIKRLNILYGIYTEGVHDPSYIEGSEGVTLADRIPKIIATNIDDDERIIFPSDDPDCTNFVPEDTDKSQMAALLRQQEAMRKRQIVLEQMIKAMTGTSASEVLGDGTEVTEDTPDTPTVRKVTKTA